MNARIVAQKATVGAQDIKDLFIGWQGDVYYNKCHVHFWSI